MYVSSAPLKSLLTVAVSILVVGVATPLPTFAQDTEDVEQAEDVLDEGDPFADEDDLFARPEDEAEGEEQGPRRFAIPDDVETIQVTGQKSDASQQGQSIAITSFNQEALDQLGVSNVQSLQQNVPSLHIGQTGTQGIITLRGVGIENLTISGEPGVLFVQDGVPLGSAVAALSAFYDVRALDVLRGPQGTQGGKHSSGGWISVKSFPPTPDFEAFGDYQIGSYDQHIFRGVLNAPIFDEKLMFRGTVRFEDRDGYQRAIGTKFAGGFPTPNTAFNKSDYWGDEHALAARVQFLSQVTDRLQLHLIGQHIFSENNGPAIHLLSDPGTFADLGCAVNLNCVPNQGPARPLSSRDPRVTTRDNPGALDIQQWFATAKAIYAGTSPFLGDVEARAQFGFNRTSTKVIFDFDNTNANASVIDTDNLTDQYTVELVMKSVEQRPFEWLLGAMWWQESKFQDGFIDLTGRNNGGDAANLTDLEADSIAGFLELRYYLIEEFHVLLGARYAEDSKAILAQPFDIDINNLRQPESINLLKGQWTALTPKALVHWQWSDSSNVSFNVTRGFKAGGFPLGAGCVPAADGGSSCDPYDAERVWQYEFTSKNEFFDERLRLNLTLFWTDYDPYQVCFVAGIAFRCFDGGTATVRGFEVEWTAYPIPELTISGNFNLLDARIDNFRIPDPTLPSFFPGVVDENGRPVPDPLSGFPQDLSGNVLPKSPKYNLTINVSYDIQLMDFGLPEWGTLTPRVGYNYQSRTFYRVWNDKQASQGAFSRVDMRLTWRSPSNRWQIEGFVDNVTDVDVINSIFLSANADGSITAQYRPPRQAGLRIKFNY
jgi:iron complex outermembrane receptor protein